MEDIVYKEQFYNYPIRSIWEAISNQEQISQWFIKADFQARVGYHYTFTHENTIVTGKILEADPVHNLVYTWIVGETKVETVVKWKLIEKANGTLVTIEHSGFDKYPKESAVSMFTSTRKGWDAVLKELNTYLQDEKRAAK